MDRNSLIGLSLIAVILGAWLYFSGPNKEQIARNKRIKDSIELAQKTVADAEAKKIVENTKVVVEDTLKSTPLVSDSVKALQLNDTYKDFSAAAKGSEEIVTIENELIKAYISTKGAHVVKVELKKYHRAGKTEPLVLFDKDSTFFSLRLDAYERSRIFSTDSFYFKTGEKAVTVSGATNKAISFKLETSKPGSYIEYVYSLKGDDYMLGCDIRFVGMQNIISSNVDQMQLNWQMQMPSQEKYIIKEREAATAYFKFTVDDPDYINARKDEEKNLNEAPVKWVSFRHQFFNATIIAETEFSKDGSFVKTSSRTAPDIVKHVSTDLGIPFGHGSNEKFGMKFYFGPTHYNTLEKYDIGLEQMIPTGWSIFSYINKWLVIPLFNVLSSVNYGIVILILTLIVKILLLPIAYKTYMSGARMRVLKPETDAINAKYGKDGDPMKKQQETMGLYRKAGVNPLSGCFPVLLQFPILIALFNFVPNAIELRQEGFLWADDLSTYDSIWTFGQVPIVSSLYGDHVSLFAMLMFVSTIIYTWMNSAMLAPQQNAQMPGMKFMMYFMPVIFLAVMNSYAAGLSWYYFLANMFTFLQTWIMKKVIDDGKIRAQLEANMKKPVKTSGFAKRLEDMAKQRQQQMSSAGNGGGKKKK